MQAAHAELTHARRMTNNEVGQAAASRCAARAAADGTAGRGCAAALGFLQQHVQWVELAAGEVLMEQGAPGDSAYLCVSGRLRVYVRNEDARNGWCARCRAARSLAR